MGDNRSITEEKNSLRWLVCRAGRHLLALPLAGVAETMRPLPVEPISGAPKFVRGLSIIRGAPVAVVDAGALFGEDDQVPGRFVTIKLENRIVALAVEGVEGIRDGALRITDLPPLLRDVADEAVGAIGSLDAQLLLFLKAGRILPDGVPLSLPARAAAS